VPDLKVQAPRRLALTSRTEGGWHCGKGAQTPGVSARRSLCDNPLVRIEDRAT
jgi:hypothetical protein